MRIPTIIGLIIISLAVSAGIVFFNIRSDVAQKQRVELYPKNIEVVNTTASSASIIWQTDSPTIGKIHYDNDKNLAQKKQEETNTPRNYHIVNLTNLTPNRKYYFRIVQDEFFYPEEFLEFNTGQISNIESLEPGIQKLLSNPVQGTIVKDDLRPVQEGLVILRIKDAISQATVITSEGNFIIPLSNLYKADLSYLFNYRNTTDATLEIHTDKSSSRVDITLPLNNPLPPLFTTQNVNLKDYLKALEAKKIQSSQVIARFDLNSDKVINADDVSLVSKSFSRNPQDKRMDFNSDNVIDQKDLQLIQSAITQ